MKDVETLYDIAGEFHGSICGGIILGVRMAHLGCRMVGLDDPNSPENRKKLVTFVEIDRCATDGIQSVTGCSLGHRSFKLLNYGALAATFFNLDSRKAVRISVQTDARDKAKTLFPEQTDRDQLYIDAYKRIPDADLFTIEEVQLNVDEMELPGTHLSHALCQKCGDEVMRGREMIRDGKIFCRRCSSLPLYYKPLKKITPP